MQNEPSAKSDVQRGATVFKLVAPQMPGGSQDSRFKPAGINEVELLVPPVPGPDTSGKPVTGIAAPPPPTGMVVAAAAAGLDDERRIIAKIEDLLRIERRAKELEEENRNLLKMVARLQAENDALKVK